MIVCHCNMITDRDIRNAVDWMRAADEKVLITPGKVFRTLGKKPDCASCVPLFIEAMARSDGFEIPVLRAVPATEGSTIRKGDSREGRSESHRISQRRTQK